MFMMIFKICCKAFSYSLLNKSLFKNKLFGRIQIDLSKSGNKVIIPKKQREERKIFINQFSDIRIVLIP